MQIAKLTDVGKRRQNNQDQADIFKNRSNQTLALLCDGMGGENAGDVASEMALYQVGVAWEKTEAMTSDNIAKWFNETVEAADRRVYNVSMQYDDLSRMGTTIVGMALLDDQGVIAHVGDSRCYRLRHHEFEQLTKDHTYVQGLLDEGVLTPEQAETHNERHKLSQAIGVDEYLDVAIDQTVLEAGDRYLLCSDGLTDMLTDAQIQDILVVATSVDEAAKQLIQQANDAGGRDNVTVVVIKIEGSVSE